MSTAKTETQNAADCRTGQSTAAGKSLSSSPFPAPIVSQTDAPFNPLIVECLRIAYRRGKAIREAQAREASGGELCQP